MKAGLKFALIAGAASLALVGCGGDSGTVPAPTSGSTTGGSTAGGSTTGGTTTGGSTSVTAADKYVGTWVGNCMNSQGFNSANQRLKRIETIVWTKMDANTLTGTRQEAFYSPTDCAGTPVMTATGFTATLKINSSTTFLGKDADAITLMSKGTSNISAGGSLILNGVTLPGDYMASKSTDGYVSISGNSWYSATSNSTVWSATPDATKQ